VRVEKTDIYGYAYEVAHGPDVDDPSKRAVISIYVKTYTGHAIALDCEASIDLAKTLLTAAGIDASKVIP